MEISEKYNKIIVSKFSTSSVLQKYIASYNGCNFEINESVFIFIESLQNSSTLADVSAEYHKRTGTNYTEEQIKEIIENYISPIINSSNKKNSKSFIFSREIISTHILGKIANSFRYLFKRTSVIIALLLFLICELYFFTNTTFELNYAMISFNSLLITLSLLFISSFIHEIGHASACKYLNVNHGGTGIGLYSIFPILYTDVSNIWSLPRKKRLLVNIAGIYFQFIFLAILIPIFSVTNSVLLKYIIQIININILITLNPFFKFDGYWIVTDLLGIPNLRHRSKELLAYCINKILKRKQIKRPYLLQIPYKYRVALITYTVLVNLFFIYFACYVFPTLCYNFFRNYPDLVYRVISDIAVGITPDFTMFQSLFIQSLFLILFISAFLKFIIVIAKKNGIFRKKK